MTKPEPEKKTIIISSEEQMKERAEQLAKHHKIILLEGELGAGKTTFTKGFAAGLGIKTHVQSPTYTYVNIYEDKLLHIDMWRIEKFQELQEKGILDLISAYEYCIIERPKFIDQLPLTNPTSIRITKKDTTTREVSLDY